MTATSWRLHKLEYLEAPAASLLPFHNPYPEGKQGGLELVHHGERVATAGEIRPDPRATRPEGHPKPGERVLDAERVEILTPLYDSTLRTAYSVRLRAEGRAVRLTVECQNSIPADIESGFCMDLYPPAFWGKTYRAGSTSGVFPREPYCAVDADECGRVRAGIMAAGARLVVAPEDPLRHLSIESLRGRLQLFDGRKGDDEAWFTLCSPIEPGASGTVVEWLITPHQDPEWRRPPVIALSQVGYHPQQAKRAVIELDTRCTNLGEAHLLRIDADSGLVSVKSGRPEPWGRFLRYDYAVFDFSEVREPGLYQVRYAEQVAGPFRIGQDVYSQGVWQPTLEAFFPVQMCHAAVWDGLRLWHGACHMDDALQAPTSHVHFDHYSQGPATDTPFEPYEHIPHLNAGGWHDAGDTDLAAGSQSGTVHMLALAREEFAVDCDQTTVLADEHLVHMYCPDGEPDILQQIAWGAECLLGGYRAAGHSFCGIVAGESRRFYQRGEVSTMTDNLIYDPSLARGERTGTHSGIRDDRWAFTNRDTSQEYKVSAALAASARVLAEWNDALAEECLETAEGAWHFEQSHQPARWRTAYVPGRPDQQEVLATAELLIATGRDEYRHRLGQLLPVVEEHPGSVGWAAVRALPHMDAPDFSLRVKRALENYARQLSERHAGNPFGVEWRPHIWGVAWHIQQMAVQQYYLARDLPKLFDREILLRVLNYVLGCHPDNNVSLVSGVGADSLTTAFGINRSSWHYVPGGVVSGTNLSRPDFPELKTDSPFLWQQSEYVMQGAASYIFLVLAADALLRR